MSETELKALKEYIDEMLGKGFIRASKSPIGAPVLFARKKDGTLRMCIDFRALNRVTIKNKYPLPLVGDLIDWLRKAKIFTKLDLRVGYNNVRIAEGHEWKTAFRTRYGAFEYLVMPFGLTNAPSIFQQFMNNIFHDMVDVCVVIYLDDILIFSDNEEEHVHQVQEVLRRLEENDLHLKPSKCEFHTEMVEYLGVLVSPKGVAMDPKKVEVIRRWKEPTCLKELQSFLGFANFYRRFIDNYSGIVKPLTALTSKNVQFKWTEKCQQVFDLLKAAFTEAPILRHFDPTLPIILESDASDYAIAAIISQPHPETGEIHPVAFHARSMGSAELNYDIYDKEMLAIVESFKQWRAYLEGARHTVQVYTDHNNLQFFTTTKKLSRRQARWSEYLSGFDFIINYRPGRLGGKPDALTRRSDVYPKKEAENRNGHNEKIFLPPERLCASLILNDDLVLNKIRKAKKDNYYQKGNEIANSNDPGPFLVEDGLLLREGLIYVPEEDQIRLLVLKNHHDHKLRGHPGINKTIKLIRRTCFWPKMHRDVKQYVNSCEGCQRAKAVRQKPFGLLKPLPIGQRPWSSISVDHITELPLSNGYDAIMIVVCRLSKMAVFVACHTMDTAEDLAKLFLRHIFSKHGLPDDIVSDRGTTFVSKFWTSLCSLLDVKLKFSTAYHPETDGQTERTNQTLEQYLRLYVAYNQDDWEELLPLAEFAYNNAPHDTTGISPFFANKGFHPRLSYNIKTVSNHAAHQKAAELSQVHQHLQSEISRINQQTREQFDKKRQDIPDNFQVGLSVWLNTVNIRTKCPTKKLDYKRIGPFKIIQKIGTHAYRLWLPKSLNGIHNVFHA
jgi:hypothetical protein